ncbi:MAG: nuclear transport factor 2 family protein [Chitinophagales bacterium]|nr:nuclear transport factor 2 family protein [Chitinophagales bacterium]
METTQATMTTQAVANRLAELCRQGDFYTAQQELYHENATSTEPEHTGWGTAQGTQAIIEKGKQWADSVAEFHGCTVSEPQVSGNFFSVAMNVETTNKEGNRINMEELGVYEVRDGKVVSEQFFY